VPAARIVETPDLHRLLEPAADCALAARLFVKGLALIYVAAFLSLTFQIEGLAGPEGILPLGKGLEQLHAARGAAAWLQVPTLFWLDAGAAALTGAAAAGALLALALLLGIGPQRLALALLFVLYLSLYHAGQVFTNFQWDYLLLEAGFLAIFLADPPGRLVIFLYHWLLFRLRFLSGLSKLASGDPSWSGFTALRYYFETQPLPHAGAWWAHQLPEPLLRAGVGLTFFSELIVPFFIFLPRPFRLFAAGVTALMQLLIMATSNHNFFNLLTLLLCLFLLDDRALRRVLPQRLLSRRATDARPAQGVPRGLTFAAASLIAAVSLANMLPMVSGRALPRALEGLAAIGPAFGIGNSYHVFPTMQTERQELTIAGSYDGRHWERYEFRYKPGALDRAPPFVVPHHPRLDWMMWFVPTQSRQVAGWFNGLIDALAVNSPAVTALLARNPFAGRPPPRYFQVLAYRYRFTRIEERERSGDWWRAEYLGEFPEVPPRRP
jgi:hypothetical protein